MVEDIYTNSLYIFSLSTLTWGQLYSESLYIPPSINDPILYLRSDNVFLSVFGIINTGYISDFLLYNITSRSWSLAEFPKTLQGRAHSAYTTLEWEGQEYLAIYGGYLANGITNSLNL